MKLIVDASVVGKWLLPEPDSDKARRLFQSWNEGQVELAAPALLSAEVGNMLWKRVVRGFLPRGDAATLFRDFSEFGLALSPIEALARAALELSLAHGHPFYDCLYVALALESRCDLVTADERLVRSFQLKSITIHLLHTWEVAT